MDVNNKNKNKELENFIIDFTEFKLSDFKEWKLMTYSNKERELLDKLAEEWFGKFSNK